MKKNQTIDIPEWLKLAALLLLGVAVLKKIGPLLLKFSGLGGLAQDTKDELKKNQVDKKVAEDPKKYTNIGGEVITTDKADEHAHQIAKALGVDPDQWSWNPWNWTEDEPAVLRALAPYNRSTFKDVLAPRYKVVIGRDLVADLKKYLSESQIEKVKSLWA